MRAARETDTVAYEDFVGRERPALVAFAWSLTGSLATAEEIAQEALVAAWRSWDTVRDYDKPGAWVRRVVANRVSTHWRSAGRERRALERLAGGTTDAVELSEPDAALWAAVRRLPARQAQAIALYYLEDKSVAETAVILDCAEGTVKSHLHKARLALARDLGLLSTDPTPAPADAATADVGTADVGTADVGTADDAAGAGARPAVGAAPPTARTGVAAAVPPTGGADAVPSAGAGSVVPSAGLADVVPPFGGDIAPPAVLGEAVPAAGGSGTGAVPDAVSGADVEEEER